MLKSSYLAILVFCLCSNVGFAQSLRIIPQLTDTLVLGNALTTNQLNGRINVVNFSLTPLDVLMKVEVDSAAVLTDSFHLFFGLTFVGGIMDVPPNFSFTLQPGDSLPSSWASFYVYPDMDGISRREEVLVVFYDENNPNDSVQHSIFYEVVSGLAAPELSAQTVHAYPNPSSGKFHLTGLEPSSAKTQLNVYDAFGALVYTESILSLEKEIDLDLRSLPSGSYRLTLSRDEGFSGHVQMLIR